MIYLADLQAKASRCQLFAIGKRVAANNMA
jgi:hypothetical protein